MRINWGTGIVMAFGLFMGFILFFVFRVQSDRKYDNELVTENYYQKDSRYSDEMRLLENGQRYPKPELSSHPEGFRLQFAPEITAKFNKGKVSLYRPSGKNLDFEAPVALSGSTLLIPENRLAGGLWDITLTGNINGEDLMWRYRIYR